MLNKLNAKIPPGALQDKWVSHKAQLRLISPANRSKIEIVVVGTGLAGASCCATLAELGYKVKAFCYQDSPRRAHSIAAQGGINAAKGYLADNDSIYRLFYDTIKGGDYRSREANVYRLAEVSTSIIDQCVAQGVPFARDYGGLLDNRSFGGVQVARTFYAKGQTGQQLLLGAYSAMTRQIAKGNIKLYPRHEMLDLVVIDQRARGIITRNLINGELQSHLAHAVVIASGGYGNVFFLSTNAMGSNATAIWRAHKKGALFANPCFTQIHPTCIPVHGSHQSKLTLMSESLRNDGRIWVPSLREDAQHICEGRKKASDIKEEDRDYYLERRYPSFGNLVPRDVASRAAKERCDKGFGIENNETREGVFLDFSSSIRQYGQQKALLQGLSPSQEDIRNLGEGVLREKYGNLFDMYERITGEDPYKTPMKIYPAVHYTMGGLWVDYNLMSTIKGCFVIGEANFSDHGANRLGASALMQGLADGYFILPYTLVDYLVGEGDMGGVTTNHACFKEAQKHAEDRLSYFTSSKGKTPIDHFHRSLGHIMWNKVGMSRNKQGLKEAIGEIASLREAFYKDLYVPSFTNTNGVNPELEKATRVADFLELAELMAMDALAREESCGGHFRQEHMNEEGEALRDDKNYNYVASWEYKGEDIKKEVCHKESLDFEFTELKSRSYK